MRRLERDIDRLTDENHSSSDLADWIFFTPPPRYRAGRIPFPCRRNAFSAVLSPDSAMPTELETQLGKQRAGFPLNRPRVTHQDVDLIAGVERGLSRGFSPWMPAALR